MYSLMVMVNGQTPVSLQFRTESAALGANETLHKDGSFAVRQIKDDYGQTLHFIPGSLVATMVQHIEKVMQAQMDMARIQNEAQRKVMSGIVAPSMINLGQRN